MFSDDEEACDKYRKEYMKAVKKYKLDKIEDGWGQSHKRYMSDAFISGFYAGRDYVVEKEDKQLFDYEKKIIELMKLLDFHNIKVRQMLMHPNKFYINSNL